MDTSLHQMLARAEGARVAITAPGRAPLTHAAPRHVTSRHVTPCHTVLPRRATPSHAASPAIGRYAALVPPAICLTLCTGQ